MKAVRQSDVAYIDAAKKNAARSLWLGLGRWWRHLLRMSGHPQRRLRLCENLSLGERRFVAVIEFEKARFLVGGTATSLALLARLGHGETAQPASGEGLPVPNAETGEDRG
jgi:flagellar biogenesis protein FliO